MSKRAAGFLLLALTISGCATIPKDADRTMDYGPYPDRYRTIIADYMAPFLHDPGSAVYSNWHGPGRGFLTTANGIFYGYRACVDLDFRNKLGAYTGKNSYLFILSNNKVMAHEGGHQPGTSEEHLIARICANL